MPSTWGYLWPTRWDFQQSVEAGIFCLPLIGQLSPVGVRSEMEFTVTSEVNLLDLIGFVGWAIGILAGASWVKRRYASRLESDPMRIFQSNITDLEVIVRLMEKSEAHYFTLDDNGSEDTQACARIAKVMATYRIRDMIYSGWLISCRDAHRRNTNPYLHVRPVPGLYVVDPR